MSSVHWCEPSHRVLCLNSWNLVWVCEKWLGVTHIWTHHCPKQDWASRRQTPWICPCLLRGCEISQVIFLSLSRWWRLCCFFSVKVWTWKYFRWVGRIGCAYLSLKHTLDWNLSQWTTFCSLESASGCRPWELGKPTRCLGSGKEDATLHGQKIWSSFDPCAHVRANSLDCDPMIPEESWERVGFDGAFHLRGEDWENI